MGKKRTQAKRTDMPLEKKLKKSIFESFDFKFQTSKAETCGCGLIVSTVSIDIPDIPYILVSLLTFELDENQNLCSNLCSSVSVCHRITLTLLEKTCYLSSGTKHISESQTMWELSCF